jgi:hypothetical protein
MGAASSKAGVWRTAFIYAISVEREKRELDGHDSYRRIMAPSIATSPAGTGTVIEILLREQRLLKK